jgi:hypothetical protein
VTSRQGASKTATKGLIVTEEGNMEEIRAGLCRKPISFSQESASVSLGPPAPLPARRAYRPEGRAYGSERYSGFTYNHSFDLEALDGLSETGSWTRNGAFLDRGMFTRSWVIIPLERSILKTL